MPTKKIRRIVKSKRHLFKKKATYFTVAISTIALASFLVYYALGPKNSTVIDATPKIAVVDSLTLEWPNSTYKQTMMDILNTTGLKIDYYPSEKVTVDFFRDLPKHNYKLIIFRVHSSATSAGYGTPTTFVFSTTELYSSQAYVLEQKDSRVVMFAFPNVEARYFGVTPLFVKDSMEGRFNDTLIIAMDGEGMTDTIMAEAFIEKGAKAFIGWDSTPSVSHTDETTVSLLRHLITQKQTVGEAVKQTMDELGPDPASNSTLLFYPDGAGSSLFLANTTATTPQSLQQEGRTPEVTGIGMRWKKGKEDDYE